MQRKAYATGAAVAAVLAVGAVGCTGGTGEGGAAADSKPGAVSAEAATAPPGTYRSLPEPCGAVDAGVLKAMLPGAGGGSAGEGDPEAYEGDQTVTYDNDRRVGCRWKSSAGPGSHHLLVDFERVVSYDPAVSDDRRAELLYEDMALEAGIPPSAPGDGGGEPAGGAGTDGPGETRSPEESGEDGRSGEPEEPRGSASPSTGESGGDGGEGDGGADAAELAPRPLEGIGDAAYLDDELVTAASGVHRDITLVFRTGNVIVTVEYEQWVADKRRLPDSAELQKRTRELAERLAGEFED
ncbi:hypothetical protein [Streptomyces sp. URMC 125]|uniref:hypothetical protein n=1 Tax=Streptomyces sp. URMC 125 TaxID=3423419 RepID=UPI003F1B5981